MGIKKPFEIIESDSGSGFKVVIDDGSVAVEAVIAKEVCRMYFSHLFCPFIYPSVCNRLYFLHWAFQKQSFKRYTYDIFNFE